MSISFSKSEKKTLELCTIDIFCSFPNSNTSTHYSLYEKVHLIFKSCFFYSNQNLLSELLFGYISMFLAHHFCKFPLIQFESNHQILEGIFYKHPKKIRASSTHMNANNPISTVVEGTFSNSVNFLNYITKLNNILKTQQHFFIKRKYLMNFSLRRTFFRFRKKSSIHYYYYYYCYYSLLLVLIIRTSNRCSIFLFCLIN